MEGQGIQEEGGKAGADEKEKSKEEKEGEDEDEELQRGHTQESPTGPEQAIPHKIR